MPKNSAACLMVRSLSLIPFFPGSNLWGYVRQYYPSLLQSAAQPAMVYPIPLLFAVSANSATFAPSGLQTTCKPSTRELEYNPLDSTNPDRLF